MSTTWAATEKAQVEGVPSRPTGARKALRPAVFVDRDGVLLRLQTVDSGPRPPRSLKEAELAPGAEDAIGRLRAAGFLTIVVSNQPDIARGAVAERAVHEMHQMLRSRLWIDAAYYCPHDNEDGCDCRKPKPGMLFRAASEWAVDMNRSCLIGDRWVDLAAAEAAGIDGILLQTSYSWAPTSVGPPSPGISPCFVGNSLESCVEFILSSGRYASSS